MSSFPLLNVSEKVIKNNTLTLTNNDLNNHVFDERTLEENISKISLNSTKDVDFVVILRSNSNLITYEFAPYMRGKVVFIFENEDVNAKRELVLNEGSELSLIVPDFNEGSRTLNITTKLIGARAKALWHLSSFSLNNDAKKFIISFAHYGDETFADMHNYGVVLDQSTLIFTGDSTIYEKVKGAETHQTARIIVFDEGSVAHADPILNIYHNDVIAASHAATVGRVNAEHLYYLNSRGLNELEAKQLITKGYLMPILVHIDDEELKESLTKRLEGVI